jgi:transglutaminase-like putative cysteine protease
MRNAAAEQLSKIISDTPRDSKDTDKAPLRKFLPEIHLHLAEGWFSLALLATVVYSTIWSIQAADWVDHLNTLTFVTAVGLLLGVLAAKQRRFSRWLVHSAAVIIGLLLAISQTAGAFYDGSISGFLQGISRWSAVLAGGGASNDDSIFLLLILALGFLLAYASAWLLYRTRNPWLLVIANGIVLLINLENVPPAYVIFLVVFLIASLLLLLRFNLFESVQRWNRSGLRYPDDLGWDIMQAGALISVGILVFSWILPGDYKNPTASLIWDSKSSPLVQLENAWDRAIAVNGGVNPANHGNFRDTLVLGGDPNLTKEIVYKVKTDDSQPQYLMLLSYDTYNNGWSIAHSEGQPLDINANTPLVTSAVKVHDVKQTIEVVAPPGELHPYIAGASAITSMSLKASVVPGSGGIVAWLGDKGNLAAGTRYVVSSSVSSADEQTLRSVPMPADAPKYNPDLNPDEPAPVETYDPQVIRDFTQVPPSISRDPRMQALLKKIVPNPKATMYDKAVALETYLRTNYKYNTNIHPRSGEDPVMWFLFDNSAKDGFCNYYSSAMTLMARSLGIPARVVAGYTHGSLENGQYIIRGVDAHSWTQVYFAGYGWVNFEPSASFTAFQRPRPSEDAASGSSASSVLGALPLQGANAKNRQKFDQSTDNGNSGLASDEAQAQLMQRLELTVGGILLLGLSGALFFGLWWRRLFRRYSLATQLYARVCMLGEWAGVRKRSSQTPYEYFQEVSVTALPSADDAIALERIGDIYVRERWADPKSEEHPRRSGEFAELAALWQRLQPRLFFYVLRHPFFLNKIPLWIGGLARKMRKKRHPRNFL